MIRVRFALPGFRRVVSLGIATVVTVALVQVATPAMAADPIVRWVSPTGTGTACAATQPCSVSTAQAQVRAAAPTMSTHLIIRFLGGTYRAINLRDVDSGANGYVVRYEAAAGARPIISGARRITRWTLHNRAKNIWKAPVASTFSSRQLYVNGVRARLATRSVGGVLGSLTKTSTGYKSTRTGMSTWRNVSDTELVFPAGGHDPVAGAAQSVAPWSWSMCGVAGVSGAQLKVDPTCWNKTKTILGDVAFVTKPTAVQNNYKLLGKPGQFYLDKRGDKVYYVPRVGENLKRASVVMPGSTTLLSALGTASSPVQNVHVAGLTFEYATWNPSPSMGLVDLQANVIAGDTATGLAMIPSAVRFVGTRNVVFERNVLRHLGGGGVSFTGGSGAVVRGNVVTDVSSTGISIGDATAWSSPAVYETGATVSNNVVKNVAVEYLGGVGIFAGWVKHTKITHNEVSDLPFMGISLGWGWNNQSGMVDNHIVGNVVRNVHRSALYDGGAIYVLGAQGSSPKSTIAKNHVSEDHRPYGAIYLDSGASNWIVQENVVEKAPHGWLYLQNMDGGTTSSNIVRTNYTDTSTQQAAPNGANSSNTLIGNLLNLVSWPASALAVTASAGLEPLFAGILG